MEGSTVTMLFKNRCVRVGILILFLSTFRVAQAQDASDKWIRPETASGSKTWGIHNGIVFSIWPNGVETGDKGTGGPRGIDKGRL
jgi:hypothetical protein